MNQRNSGRDRESGERSVEADVSRRNVLRSGAIASGTLLLGGATASEDVRALRQGGSGFISVEDFDEAMDDDRTFKILDADGWHLEHAAGCGGPSKRRDEEYTGYSITFAAGVDDRSDPPTLGHLYVEPDRDVRTGDWYDITSARDCPLDATVTDDSGVETQQSVSKVAFRPTDFGGRPGFRAGAFVVDDEDPDPDPAVVLAVFDVPISDWIVYGTETVAFQNPSYDPGERVVVVAFEDLLAEGWSTWEDADPEDLFDGVVSRGVKFHAFPQARLARRRSKGP